VATAFNPLERRTDSPQLLPDTPESSYEEFPDKPDLNKKDRAQPNFSAANGRPSQENYRIGGQARGPERRPTPEQQYGRRSEDNRPFGRAPSQASRVDDGESVYSGPRGRPSNDTEGQYPRKASDAVPPGPSSATAGMVIPNKSTIAEEEIQVPYGRDDSDSRPRDSDIRDSVVTDISGGADVAKPSGGLNALASATTSKWDTSPNTPQLQGGLSALAAGFDKRNEPALSDDDDLKTDFFENSTVGGRARSASGGSNPARRMPESRGVSAATLSYGSVLSLDAGARPRGDREDEKRLRIPNYISSEQSSIATGRS
jgi:protein SPA2